MSDKHRPPGQSKPPSPETRRLLAALEAACAAEPQVAEFVRRSAEQNARRLIGDFNAHSGIMVFEPPWLLDAAQALVDALREAK